MTFFSFCRFYIQLVFSPLPLSYIIHVMFTIASCLKRKTTYSEQQYCKKKKILLTYKKPTINEWKDILFYSVAYLQESPENAKCSHPYFVTTAFCASISSKPFIHLFFNQHTASVSNKKSITGEITWYTSFSATYRRWNRTFSQHAYNEPVVVQGDFFWQTKAEMQEQYFFPALNHNRSRYHCSDLRSRQKPTRSENRSTDDKGPL